MESTPATIRSDDEGDGGEEKKEQKKKKKKKGRVQERVEDVQGGVQQREKTMIKRGKKGNRYVRSNILFSQCVLVGDQ